VVGDTEKTLDAMAVNISDNGLCLKLAAPLMEGQVIKINIMQAVIACSIASVRWVNRKQDGSYLAGLSCCGY
jgi:hypothetical protein